MKLKKFFNVGYYLKFKLKKDFIYIKLIFFFLIFSTTTIAQSPCPGGGGDGDGCQGCGGGPNGPGGGIPIYIPTLHATDPNEILGPTGLNVKKWMAAKDKFGFT